MKKREKRRKTDSVMEERGGNGGREAQGKEQAGDRATGERGPTPLPRFHRRRHWPLQFPALRRFLVAVTRFPNEDRSPGSPTVSPAQQEADVSSSWTRRHGRGEGLIAPRGPERTDWAAEGGEEAAGRARTVQLCEARPLTSLFPIPGAGMRAAIRKQSANSIYPPRTQGHL